MQVKSAVFVKSAADSTGYPPETVPEIAFAGRSNVGKSSLINTLLNRKSLVKTSSTPGRTQLINFFLINDNFHFVDLPGYGYAKVPLAVKKNWGPMMEAYLSKRRSLAAVVFILDIRRVPSQEDMQMLDWLQSYSVNAVIVTTKCDKVSKNEKAKNLKIISEKCGKPVSSIITFSSLAKEGVEALWGRIEESVSSFVRV